jgi:hypothetical protein
MLNRMVKEGQSSKMTSGQRPEKGAGMNHEISGR